MRTLFAIVASSACASSAALFACDGANAPPPAAAQNAVYVPPATTTTAAPFAVPNPIAGRIARGNAFRIAVAAGRVCLVFSGGVCEGCTTLHAWARNDDGDREEFELGPRAPREIAGEVGAGELAGCVSNQHPSPLVKQTTKWIGIGGVSWHGSFDDGNTAQEVERIVFDPPPDPNEEVDDAPKASASGGESADKADEMIAGTTYEGVVAADESRFYRVGGHPLHVVLAARVLCKRGDQSIAAGALVEDGGEAQPVFDAIETWPEEPAEAGNLDSGQLFRVSNQGPCRVEYRITVNDTGGD
jgi:hypothetical protein